VRRDPRDFLPLKDLVFRILLELAEGEQHGWGLVQGLAPLRYGSRLLPGHLYRTLDRMLADGFIEERERPTVPQWRESRRGTAPSRSFRITPLGLEVAKAETLRLEALVRRSRSGALLRQ
jgi:DNA-binding PadR family transcriptional regulator